MRRNFGVGAFFLGIHPELKRFLCPKLDENQKRKTKVLTQKWSGFCVRSYEKTEKKGLRPEMGGFCARKVYCLSYHCNLMINNNMSVRSKFMRVRSL